MPKRDHAVKWEEVPLTTTMENAADGESNNLKGADGGKAEATPKTLKQKIKKFLKLLLPHVGLTVVLLSYIVLGAVVLQALESDTELERRRSRIANISRIYGDIINSTWKFCTKTPFEASVWRNHVHTQLMALSSAHEYDVRQPVEEQEFTLDTRELRSRWTFQASVLYALTVLTTTGYDHITPQTDAGKLLSVFFGLIGIPLMFITAADIGKFLSEIFVKIYAKSLKLCRLLWRKIRQSRGKETSYSDPLGSELDEEFGDGPDGQRMELPIFAYFGLILSYCAIGGLLYTRWETGPLWSFLHAFHFSFNTITTISLGNILVKDPLYLCLIVGYVIIGLAVVTMCVDLASSQLKVFFTKLHYFGRKMRVARSAFANMSDDIKEAMRIIATIRRSKRHRGGTITVEDIKQYLEVQQQFLLRPYVPRNIHFIRFVDEEDNSFAITGSDMSLSLPLQDNNVGRFI